MFTLAALAALATLAALAVAVVTHCSGQRRMSVAVADYVLAVDALAAARADYASMLTSPFVSPDVLADHAARVAAAVDMEAVTVSAARAAGVVL